MSRADHRQDLLELDEFGDVVPEPVLELTTLHAVASVHLRRDSAGFVLCHLRERGGGVAWTVDEPIVMWDKEQIAAAGTLPDAAVAIVTQDSASTHAGDGFWVALVPLDDGPETDYAIQPVDASGAPVGSPIAGTAFRVPEIEEDEAWYREDDELDEEDPDGA